jgi:predicted dehydrogenase
VLKVGIVGCGKTADSQASQIQRIRQCDIVGVCDRETLMAQQLPKRLLAQDGHVLIPYREVLLTARIMDATFDQIHAGGSRGLFEVRAEHNVPQSLAGQLNQ